MQCVEITKNELRDLYKNQKLTTYKIADIYNCSQTLIWKKLEDYRIKRLPNGRRSLVISKTKLRNLYIKQHLSSRKIAKLYHCAYSTIDNKIKGYGLPTRNISEAHVLCARKASLQRLLCSLKPFLKHNDKKNALKVAFNNIEVRNRLHGF